jgi:hypothetical protein
MIDIIKPFPNRNILNGKYLFSKFYLYYHEEEPHSLQKDRYLDKIINGMMDLTNSLVLKKVFRGYV